MTEILFRLRLPVCEMIKGAQTVSLQDPQFRFRH